MSYKEYLQEASLPPEVKGLSVKKVGKEKYDMEFDRAVETTYAIKNKKGKVVGELKYETYFGNVWGNLWNRSLPDLGDYKGAGPLQKLHRFFKTKTGLKWLDVARRQGIIK